MGLEKGRKGGKVDGDREEKEEEDEKGGEKLSSLLLRQST